MLSSYAVSSNWLSIITRSPRPTDIPRQHLHRTRCIQDPSLPRTPMVVRTPRVPLVSLPQPISRRYHLPAPLIHPQCLLRVVHIPPRTHPLAHHAGRSPTHAPFHPHRPTPQTRHPRAPVLLRRPHPARMEGASPHGCRSKPGLFCGWFLPRPLSYALHLTLNRKKLRSRCGHAHILTVTVGSPSVERFRSLDTSIKFFFFFQCLVLRPVREYPM